LRGRSTHLLVKTGTAAVKVYFSAADYAADERYVLVGTSEVFSAPVEVDELWLKGSGGTAAVELVAILKS